MTPPRSLEIREVDPFDDPALDAWHGVYVAGWLLP